ncbi:hypothetical protein HHI36_019930, partial [Cryptolaemus montrouzieri]
MGRKCKRHQSLHITCLNTISWGLQGRGHLIEREQYLKKVMQLTVKCSTTNTE